MCKLGWFGGVLNTLSGGIPDTWTFLFFFCLRYFNVPVMLISLYFMEVFTTYVFVLLEGLLEDEDPQIRSFGLNIFFGVPFSRTTFDGRPDQVILLTWVVISASWTFSVCLRQR